MSSAWSCRCGAKNEAGWRYCEGCGAENPQPAARAKPAAPPVPENVQRFETPDWLKGPPPLSAEENRKRLRECLDRVMNAHSVTKEKDG